MNWLWNYFLNRFERWQVRIIMRRGVKKPHKLPTPPINEPYARRLTPLTRVK